jgi:hypothetical protein
VLRVIKEVLGMAIYEAIQVAQTVDRMLSKQPLIRKTENYTEHQMKEEAKARLKK